MHDTTKLLNNDDALELFTATLPSPSLAQLHLGTTSVISPMCFFIIEEMVGPLNGEKDEDDEKKAYCVQSFDKTEDEAKAYQIAGHKDTIEDHVYQMANAGTRIAPVQNSISELDDSVGGRLGSDRSNILNLSR